MGKLYNKVGIDFAPPPGGGTNIACRRRASPPRGDSKSSETTRVSSGDCKGWCRGFGDFPKSSGRFRFGNPRHQYAQTRWAADSASNSCHSPGLARDSFQRKSSHGPCKPSSTQRGHSLSSETILYRRPPKNVGRNPRLEGQYRRMRLTRSRQKLFGGNRIGPPLGSPASPFRVKVSQL